MIYENTADTGLTHPHEALTLALLHLAYHLWDEKTADINGYPNKKSTQALITFCTVKAEEELHFSEHDAYELPMQSSTCRRQIVSENGAL